MFIPSDFKETDPAKMHSMVLNSPLGTLVTHTENGLDANHLPFDLDVAKNPAGILRAHIARENPLAAQIKDGMDVLVIFKGAQGYISPSWYPNKHITHRFVPTWNYEVVHAYGRMQLMDDERFTRGLLARLTRMHETGQKKPWKMGDAPADYLDHMLKAIVGLEIQITKMDCVRKLSQNREQVDFDGAIKGLRESGQDDLANAMLSTRVGQSQVV
jgi:transcriptional regulator